MLPAQSEDECPKHNLELRFRVSSVKLLLINESLESGAIKTYVVSSISNKLASRNLRTEGLGGVRFGYPNSHQIY